MKEKDVTYKYDEHQIVYIVEKEDGSYGSVQAGSYMFEEHGDDFREKLAYWAKQNTDDLTSGSISPVAYHMQRLHMTPPDVAARTGIRAGKVKNHMRVDGFGRATVAELHRYAEIFGVPAAALFQIVVQPEKGASIVHKPTRNPHVVLTTCEERS